MKNLFKAALVLATASSMLVACNGNGNKNASDSTAVDSTSVKTSADTTTTIDTAKTGTSLLGDTTAKAGDTISKTIKKTTVVKKSVTKNN